MRGLIDLSEVKTDPESIEERYSRMPKIGDFTDTGDPEINILTVISRRKPETDRIKFAASIIQRLKKEYPSGTFHCVCDCFDASIVKEKAEIWQNHDRIKISDYETDRIIIFRTTTCPICGKTLPTPDGGRETNGYDVI